MFLLGPKTEVFCRCSVVWHGQPYIFGGAQETTQISTVKGCKLERIDTLPFEHIEGACGMVNETSIYLCFNAGDRDDFSQCRVGPSPTGSFSKIEKSSFDHRATRLGASPGILCFQV